MQKYICKCFKEREKTALNYFSNLPDKVRNKLPIPIGFRAYPIKLQKKIHKIYYQAGEDFATKLLRISDLIDEAENSFPDSNKDSDWLAFEVNVTSKISGFYVRF